MIFWWKDSRARVVSTALVTRAETLGARPAATAARRFAAVEG
jgi:hypothetical protein